MVSAISTPSRVHASLYIKLKIIAYQWISVARVLISAVHTHLIFNCNSLG